ncbi:MAG: hypothetical protein HY738_05750, partial [Bacteroidia bacterium]|nr:hypothetical protein [Bacteroidia bacterium]
MKRYFYYVFFISIFVCNRTNLYAAAAPVASDDPCTPTALSVGASCSYSSYANTGATASIVTDPGCAGSTWLDVWFSVTVPATGHLIIETQAGTLTDMGMAIYTTTNCAQANKYTLIECDDDDGTGLMPFIDNSLLTPGATLLIRLWDYGGTDFGDFGICVYDPPAPANNNCSGATVVTPAATCNPVNGDVAGATQSLAGCLGTANDDVWFSFVAAATTQSISVTASASFDPVVEIFTGACASLSSLSCSDAGFPTGGTGTITIQGLNVGQTYYYRVYDYYSGIPATTTFTTCVINPPVNDECSGALPATVGATCNPVNGNVANASTSLTGCLGTANDDIWYSFVAANTSQVINVTSSANFDPVVEIFSGTCASLSSLVCNDGAFLTNSTGSLIVTGLTIGQTYYYRVYDWDSDVPSTTTFTTCVTNPPTCPAGLGAGVINVGALPYNVNNYETCGWADNITSGLVPVCGSANYYNDEETVYIFTPATSGSVTFNLSDVTGSWSGLMLYDGCPFSGTCVANAQSSTGPKTFCTGVIAGHTYYLIVDSYDATGGCLSNYDLSISTPSAGLANDDPCGATALTVGAACNYTNSTNSCANSSAGIPAPGCANYQGSDVWFTAVVPSTGGIIIDTDDGVITDGGMAVYSGTCSSLTLVACDDDNSANGSMPKLTLSGQTPGTTLWIRVWEYGNDNNGTFGICAMSYNPPDPNNQDCMGAIPVCQNTYSNPVSYSGEGAYPDEISETGGCPTNCMLSGEKNDVWYVFTVQSNGNLNFTIDPVDNTDDYDWAVYDLTVDNCQDILTDPSLMVSCNWSAADGTTGAGPGNSLDCQGAGGGLMNAPISVNAGQTYVLNVSNFSSTQNGYTLSFETSTASIFDNIPPAFQSVDVPIPCGSTVLSFHFSENVECNTVTTADFTLTGPGGPYTLSNLASPQCGAGATYGSDYSVTVSPPLSTSGTFTLSLVNTAGSVEDVCDNIAPPASFNFIINNITATTSQTNVTCRNGNNGTATMTGSAGTSPYTYLWSTGATTQSITGLIAGTYTGTVTDALGCKAIATVTITQPAGMIGSFTSVATTCGLSNGTATASITTAGNNPYDYVWSNGSNTMNTNSTTNTISGLAAGPYTVTITDDDNCTITGTVNVAASSAPTAGFTFAGNQCRATNSINFTNTGSSGAGVTYSWSFPSGTPSTSTAQNPSGVTWAAAGTYAVVQTVAQGGCTATATVNVTIYPNPTVTFSGQVNPSCSGSCNGSVTANPGGAGYSYIWNDPAPVQTTQTATALCAGNYNVTVTSPNACTGVGTVTLTAPAPIVLNASRTNVLCFGQCTGTANVTVTSGGTAPFTYLWSNSATTANITALCAGIFSVTVTDANGCTQTSSVTISQPAAALSSTISGVNATCYGNCNGTATATPSGGTSPYTYVWNDPAPAQSTQTATALCAGTYNVTITDANSCTTTNTINITSPNPLVVAISTTQLDCFNDCDGTATATVSGGTSPYTYIWNDPAPAQSTQTATGLCAGTYYVTVTDANGCTGPIAPPPVTTCFEITDILVNSCGGSQEGVNEMVTIQIGPAAVNTSTLSITWPNNPWLGLCQNATTASIVAAINATITAGGQLIEPVGGVIPAGAEVLIFTSTAVAYSNFDFSDLDHTVYVIFQCSGNTNGHFANTDANPASSRTITITFGGACNDAATYYPYYINNIDGESVSFTASGSWVNYNNGCVAPIMSNYEAEIIQPPQLTATTTQINVTCNGGNNGSATVTAGGGTPTYTYDWSPNGYTGDGTVTYSNLPAGTYTVTVTDSKGCTKTATVTITQPAVLTATITSQTNVSCNGGNNGSATVTAGGGTAPYAYVWNDPAPAQSTATVTGLTAGTWTVTVTDANGCTKTASVTITQPAVLTATITAQTNVNCNGASTGSATVTAGGGTALYSYVWNDPAPAQSTATVTGLTAGTWTVTVTDANGCTKTTSVTITQPAVLTATITAQTNVSCNGGNNGSATVTAGGGTAPYSYVWNDPAPAQSTATVNALTAGTWTVTVTDANSCTVTASVTITQPAVLTATITAQTNVSCNGGNNGSATVTAGGGTLPYTYVWNDPAPAQSTATVTALTAGTWTVTVTDANGCTKTASVTVTQPAVLTANITSQTNITCNGGNNGSATVTAGGGTAPYTYVWNDPAPAQSTATVTALTAGTWTVTVTDVNSCTVTANVTITQPAVLTANITAQTNVSCNGGANGSATVTAGGGTAPYTYVWNDPAPAQSTATVTG